MKRILSLVLAAVLTVLPLSACGGGSTSANSYNVGDVAKAVGDVCKIENAKEFTEDEMTYDMSLDKSAYEEFSGQRTTTNGMSGAVLVVKASAGNADTVKTALEAYRDGIVAQFENYKADFPIGYEQTKNGRVVAKGDYVVLAIAGEGVEYTEVDKAIDEALK